MAVAVAVVAAAAAGCAAVGRHVKSRAAGWDLHGTAGEDVARRSGGTVDIDFTGMDGHSAAGEGGGGDGGDHAGRREAGGQRGARNGRGLEEHADLGLQVAEGEPLCGGDDEWDAGRRG